MYFPFFRKAFQGIAHGVPAAMVKPVFLAAMFTGFPAEDWTLNWLRRNRRHKRAVAVWAFTYYHFPAPSLETGLQRTAYGVVGGSHQ
jgi:hypothetical protein